MNIEIKQVLVFILSPKAVILCVEPYLELKDSTFFFMGGAALYPQTSGSTQTPLGDRGTPLIVTGSTYGKSTKMWKNVGILAQSSKSTFSIALSRGFEPLQGPFLMFVYHTFLHAEHR